MQSDMWLSPRQISHLIRVTLSRPEPWCETDEAASGTGICN
jgi:hypothetical protein